MFRTCICGTDNLNDVSVSLHHLQDMPICRNPFPEAPSGQSAEVFRVSQRQVSFVIADGMIHQRTFWNFSGFLLHVSYGKLLTQPLLRYIISSLSYLYYLSLNTSWYSQCWSCANECPSHTFKSTIMCFMAQSRTSIEFEVSQMSRLSKICSNWSYEVSACTSINLNR